MNEENVQKTYEIVEKAQILVKRIIIAILIFFMSFTMLFEVGIFAQTIRALKYEETTATYIQQVENEDDDIFNSYLYNFEDKNGNKQEIIVDVSKSFDPEDEIMVKYDKSNPQDFYTEYSLMDTQEFIWFAVKLVFIIFLAMLFLNKNWLSKINLSVGKRNHRR